MPTLSMFYGIIVYMYNEKGGKHNTDIHKEELQANWQLLSRGEKYFRIDPLK